MWKDCIIISDNCLFTLSSGTSQNFFKADLKVVTLHHELIFGEFLESFRRACSSEFSESFRRACLRIKEQIGLLHWKIEVSVCMCICKVFFCTLWKPANPCHPGVVICSSKSDQKLRVNNTGQKGEVLESVDQFKLAEMGDCHFSDCSPLIERICRFVKPWICSFKVLRTQ